MKESPLSTLPALPRGFSPPFKVELLKIIMPLRIGQFIITLAALLWCQLKERRENLTKIKNKAFYAIWKWERFCWNLLK